MTATATAFRGPRTGLPELKVLSVKQPWAWQIMHEKKDIENRLVPTGGYRGWVAIQAARHPDSEAMRLLPSVAPSWVQAPRFFEYGAVIGVVRLLSSHDSGWCGNDQFGNPLSMCSPWATRGYHHWVLADATPLPLPIVAPAGLPFGLWRAEDELRERIADQLGW